MDSQCNGRIIGRLYRQGLEKLFEGKLFLGIEIYLGSPCFSGFCGNLHHIVQMDLALFEVFEDDQQIHEL